MSRYLTLLNGAERLVQAIAASAGAADAAKIIRTNNAGKLDDSLIARLVGQAEGLTLSRNSSNPTTQIDVSAGRLVVDSSGDRYICISPGTITKRLDTTWAAGSGNGGRFAGTVSANQWWHVFVIYNNSTGVVDFGFDASSIAANKPSGYSARMIGSIKTDSSSNILDFIQIGDTFQWKTEIEDYRGAIATTATLYTVSVPPIAGITALVRIAAGLPTTGNTNAILVTSPLVNDQAPGAVGAGSASVESYYTIAIVTLQYTQSAVERVLTNTGQVRARASFGSYSTNPRIATIGYVHPRGNQ